MHCLMEAWHKNEPAITNWLLKKTGDHAQTQDLVQNLFIKALQKKTLFCTLTDAKSWLFKVAHNSLMDEYRKAKLEMGSQSSEFEEGHEDAPIINLQQCLIRVMSELDEAEHAIIDACDIHGMPQAEYAVINNLSLSATKSKVQRARKKLRQQMTDACLIEFDKNQVCGFTPRK